MGLSEACKHGRCLVVAAPTHEHGRDGLSNLRVSSKFAGNLAGCIFCMDDSAGLLSTASAKDELAELATRLIVEEVLEGKAGDAVGRDYYSTGPSGSPRTQVGNLAFLPPRT